MRRMKKPEQDIASMTKDTESDSKEGERYWVAHSRYYDANPRHNIYTKYFISLNKIR